VRKEFWMLVLLCFDLLGKEGRVKKGISQRDGEAGFLLHSTKLRGFGKGFGIHRKKGRMAKVNFSTK